MNFLKFLLVIAAIGLGVHVWQGQAKRNALAAVQSESPSGFLPIVMPDGAAANTVLILAPENCPSDAAQRADALAEQLGRRGIPHRRSSSYSSAIQNPSQEQRANLERTAFVMNGEIPAVFVNGMGKANPSVEEVIAEYERTR